MILAYDQHGKYLISGRAMTAHEPHKKGKLEKQRRKIRSGNEALKSAKTGKGAGGLGRD